MSIDWSLLTKMPVWLARQGSELNKLRRAAVKFWQRFVDLMEFPAKQLDPMTAELELVHLLAWEREISQLATETEAMYRTRVKYALPFAKGAGSKVGWLSMFEKLGIPWITINERVSDVDWDVVDLQLLDNSFGNQQALLELICRQYGRTTRRYQFTTIAQMHITMPLTTFASNNDLAIAALSTHLKPAKRIMTMAGDSSYHVAATEQRV
ncbi:phage tail protein [Alkalimonas mucilaginosa]|uniref:Phage tail protein n=1 Tax=Alkalimonas mucilaginosa TaxID=3057676 RepID=A0ABU7JD64_9GAMM|nr:phage tail protein [Alkalimonas sp. MEB004]MEE2023595.1 phage tail protein [Alkalimonas sp. MEB004]